jgi:hypothetical protein
MTEAGDNSPPLTPTLASNTRAAVFKAVSASKQKAVKVADNSSALLLSLLSTILTAVLVFAVSVFMYATFYYSYIPLEVKNLPVNLYFQPCPDHTVDRCSYPRATVILSRKHQLLQSQLYSIRLTIALPDSPSTEEVGMFMSCINITSASDELIAHSCKSAVADYRSPLLRTFDTLVYFPALVTGYSSQKQTLNIDYFNDYQPDPHTPAHSIQLEVQSNFLQVSSTQLHIEASLTGLRHLMYRHSWISSVLGVGTIMLAITTIIAVSWARFNLSKDGEGREEEESVGKPESFTPWGNKPFKYDRSRSTSVPSFSVNVISAYDFSDFNYKKEIPLLIVRILLYWCLLVVKVVVVLVLVTVSYEAYRLGMEDKMLIVEASKEDIYFSFVFIQEKISSLIGAFYTES